MKTLIIELNVFELAYITEALTELRAKKMSVANKVLNNTSHSNNDKMLFSKIFNDSAESINELNLKIESKMQQVFNGV